MNKISNSEEYVTPIKMQNRENPLPIGVITFISPYPTVTWVTIKKCTHDKKLSKLSFTGLNII